MADRNFGLFRENERKYLAANRSYPSVREVGEYEGGGNKAKYRIKDEVANPESFRTAVSEFRSDLMALSLFQMNEKEGGWYDWQEIILPNAKDDIKRLRDHLDHLVELAEEDQHSKHRDELAECLSELDSDLEHARRYFTGDTELLQKVEMEDGQVLNPDKLADELEEYETRKQVLIAVLRKEGLTRILEYIDTNGKTDLPNKRMNGNGRYWTALTTQYLVNEWGLAEKDEISNSYFEYELTRRGEVVCNTWKAIKNSSAVETLEEGVDEQQAAHYLFKFYFDAKERW